MNHEYLERAPRRREWSRWLHYSKYVHSLHISPAPNSKYCFGPDPRAELLEGYHDKRRPLFPNLQRVILEGVEFQDRSPLRHLLTPRLSSLRILGVYCPHVVTELQDACDRVARFSGTLTELRIQQGSCTYSCVEDVSDEEEPALLDATSKIISDTVCLFNKVTVVGMRFPLLKNAWEHLMSLSNLTTLQVQPDLHPELFNPARPLPLAALSSLDLWCSCDDLGEVMSFLEAVHAPKLHTLALDMTRSCQSTAPIPELLQRDRFHALCETIARFATLERLELEGPPPARYSRDVAAHAVFVPGAALAPLHALARLAALATPHVPLHVRADDLRAMAARWPRLAVLRLWSACPWARGRGVAAADLLPLARGCPRLALLSIAMRARSDSERPWPPLTAAMRAPALRELDVGRSLVEQDPLAMFVAWVFPNARLQPDYLDDTLQMHKESMEKERERTA